MPRKAFKVAVELEIQAVTCPGVWLCPKGGVTLRVAMLDSTFETPPLPPVFPLLYHTQLLFRKTFRDVHNLTHLQALFSRQTLCVSLVQRFPAAGRTALASFQTSLAQLLYPSPCGQGLTAGVDVDLLMEPTKSFPGILAPKIEVSTRTTIDEVFDSLYCDDCDVTLVNPKMICSKRVGARRQRQERVCHSRPRPTFARPTAHPRVCHPPAARTHRCDPRCARICRPDCCLSEGDSSTPPNQPFKWQSDPANQRSRRSRSQCPRSCLANGSAAMPKHRDVARVRSKSRSKRDSNDNFCDVCSSYARAFDTAVQCVCPVKLPRKPRANTCRCECARSRFTACPPECAAAASAPSETRRRSGLDRQDWTQSTASSSSRGETPSAKLTRVPSYPSSFPSEEGFYTQEKDGFYTPEKDGFYTPENNGEDVSGKEGKDKPEEEGGRAAGSRYLLQDAGRYPSIEVTGRYPANETDGRYPTNETDGRYPTNETDGRYPTNETDGRYPANETDGRYPTDETDGRYPADIAQRYSSVSRHEEDIRHVSASGEQLPQPPDGNSSRLQFYQSLDRCYARLRKIDAPCSEQCRC